LVAKTVDKARLSDALRLLGTTIGFHVDAGLIHDPSYRSDAAAALQLATQAIINLAGRAGGCGARERNANGLVGQHVAGTHNHELDPGATFTPVI
jgi:hypothetical protein